MNLHWQGGITSTELSMDYPVAVKTMGFGQVGPFFGVRPDRGPIIFGAPSDFFVSFLRNPVMIY